MSIWHWLKQNIATIWTPFLNVLQFVLKGVSRIFAPSEKTYPATGIQPYEGTPNKE